MDWDKLRVFHAVAMAGSFTKATRTLNVSQSAISRQVSILEDELGTPLFKRLPRGLELTEPGKALKETTIDVFSKLAMTEAAIEELKNYPRGRLTVATSIAFGSLWLAPRLQEFLDQYPDVKLKLLLKDEDFDLNVREADVGISLGKINGPDLIHSEPITYPFRIYASPSYLKKFGIPKTAGDLDHHRIIVFGKEMPHIYSNLDWLLKEGTNKVRTPYLVINSAQAIYKAVCLGLGIAALQQYIVGKEEGLVEILTDIPPITVNRYIVYPSQLKELKIVQVFIDFLLRKMQEEEL